MNLPRPHAAAEALRSHPAVRRAARLARTKLPAPAKRRLRQAQHAVLGRHTASATRSRLSAARAAFGVGSYEEARTHVERALAANPKDTDALDLASRIGIKQGRFDLAAGHASRRLEITKAPKHWGYARKLLGRVRETDPGWRPQLTASPPQTTPDAAPASSQPAPHAGGRALYLAKESRPFLDNGFCTRTHESLQALVRHGRDVLGVTMPGFPGVLGVEEPPAHSVVEDVTYRHLLPYAGRPLRALAFDEYLDLTARVLAGVVATERPQLLHVASGHRGFDTALPGSAVARWAGLPWLYEVRSFFETTWTDDPRYAESADYYHRRFATETAMMSAADLVVTLSGPMRSEIIDTHGVAAEKVRVVPNAVDLSRFEPTGRDPELRARLGLGETFTLGYVSNLSHPREGQEVLIEAVAKLRSAGHNVTGLLVGDGNRREELEGLARRFGVRSFVTFTGNVAFHEVAGHYAQIDLFVVPRVDERAARMVSPMKPFEAMAMRVPLLLADLPALSEIAGVDEHDARAPGAASAPGAPTTPGAPRARGVRAHTFRAGDADALAAAARDLLEAPEERQRLVETAADWVARERSWSAVARALSEAYDELITRGPSQPAASDRGSHTFDPSTRLEVAAC